ncbi:CRISPR-associated endonuclease Cas3'' [uncultured Mailhella sp.]|uniref:CRISPR-associated endonuclease Cas3'' n=1 Tax=uncultured Mailhella sp. TaxID=1981031 RepID=UPI00345BF102
MHVVFISACCRRAVRRTRRILDSYAVRAGERCWLSPMTEEGLQQVRTALAAGATRQTAVACYRNDGGRCMKLLWVVGSRRSFGPEGRFPVGRRRKKTPVDLPEWVRIAALLVRLAGLLHDLGKGSCKFQKKLRGLAERSDAVRHEWISRMLWEGLRAGASWDEAWEALGRMRCTETRLGERTICNASRYGIASAWECLDALIALHHGLFSSELPSPEGRLVRKDGLLSRNAREELFHPWAEVDASLLEAVRRLYRRLEPMVERRSGEEHTPYWRALFLYARAALIFADHTVSAMDMPPAPVQEGLFANTARGGAALKQPLEQHVRMVSERASDVLRRMVQLARQPERELDGLSPCALEAVLRPSGPGRFAWQDAAADACMRAREAYPESGVLLFDMAGTGSGKTRMNVRAACLLSRMGEPRLSIALNLRTLTLQTGAALEKQLGISTEDMATVVGDAVSRALFLAAEREEQNGNWADDDGNPGEVEASTSGGHWVLPPWLEAFFPRAQERRVMGAPLLVSTIDYLVAAGEPHLQGHHVKALLRLMSADLVLDEVDSYEPEALVAVLRLVQWSAFFGRNVICSTATLSRPVAEAVEEAYASGAELARELKGGSREGTLYVRIYVDDMLAPETRAFSAASGSRERGEMAGRDYENRVQAQLEALRRRETCRLARLCRVEEREDGWREAVLHAVRDLHAAHALEDERTGTRYSFGLVRVANIATAVDTARFLAGALPCARVACYHGNDWKIARFHKERRLDVLLSRAGGERHITEDAEIHALLSQASDKQEGVSFIVVATPVEEVGRDHDFDWAVIDVSSAQSLVQTAGRVNRHRCLPCRTPNIAVLQFNWRHCHNAERGMLRLPAFCLPGYERAGRKGRYETHDLEKLLPWSGEELPVSAALRLDTERCALARRDDRAVTERLREYFAPEGEGEGLFSCGMVPAQLLSDRIYKDTPLREQSGSRSVWRVREDEDGRAVFEELVVCGGSRGVREEWVERDERFWRTVPSAPHAWLGLSVEEMSLVCEKTGIQKEKSMIVELQSYENGNINEGKPVVWEYDGVFGIKRCSTNME